MAKMFRSWDVDQGLLPPPLLHEFIPPGHIAHFGRDTVRDALDFSAILNTYSEERGCLPYAPGMMVTLLLYGCSLGLYSSRLLVLAREEQVDVMAVTGLNRSDFRTTADFCKRHLMVMSDRFMRELPLCQAAGLVQFAHVVVDGTEVKANVSRNKAVSHRRMKKAEVADPPAPNDESGLRASSCMPRQGRSLRGEEGGLLDRAQRNFTKSDNCILPTRDEFVEGYNRQIAVDATHQIIVAHRLVTDAADACALLPLLDDVRPHLGRKPSEVSGDAGIANEASLVTLKERRITAYLAPSRAHHGEADAVGRRMLTKTPLMRAMAAPLKRPGRRSRYRLSEQVVEPLFGQMKQG